VPLLQSDGSLGVMPFYPGKIKVYNAYTPIFTDLMLKYGPQFGGWNGYLLKK
jgi:hypothetical protein